MATNDKLIRYSIPLASADFDTIKTSLQQYMSGQQTLADFNFNGAVLNVFLDVLSLNSQINAFFLNMVGNEAFLSTAVKRDSVVARAEAIGYEPRSMRSASTTLYVTFVVANNPASLTIPQYTTFTATAGGQTYTFYTTEEVTIYPNSAGQFIAPSLNVVEGKLLTFKWIVDQTIINDGVVIPNPNIDTTLINVSVAPNSDLNAEYQPFQQPQDITLVTSTTNAWYMRYLDGFVNVYFGDGILGTQLSLGEVVSVNYFISSGDAANSCAIFTMTGAVTNVTSANVIANSLSTGGAQPETIASIKFNAPKANESQNRAVTDTDYAYLVKKNFSNIAAAISWGGEDNTPPSYGNVFISVSPTTGYYLTTTQKNTIYNFIISKNVSGITPVIVDADYIFVRIVDTVTYDSTLTNLTEGQIETVVTNAVSSYATGAFGQYDQTLRKSIISRYIDNSDPSIISNTSSYMLEKRIFPTLNSNLGITQMFSNAIIPGSFFSSTFNYNGYVGVYFFDNGSGVIGIYQTINNITTTIVSNIGTINYTTGQIVINALIITAIAQIPSQQDNYSNAFYMSFFANPVNEDVLTNKQQIVKIGYFNVTAVPNATFIS